MIAKLASLSLLIVAIVHLSNIDLRQTVVGGAPPDQCTGTADLDQLCYCGWDRARSTCNTGLACMNNPQVCDYAGNKSCTCLHEPKPPSKCIQPFQKKATFDDRCCNGNESNSIPAGLPGMWNGKVVNESTNIPGFCVLEKVGPCESKESIPKGDLCCFNTGWSAPQWDNTSIGTNNTDGRHIPFGVTDHRVFFYPNGNDGQQQPPPEVYYSVCPTHHSPRNNYDCAHPISAPCSFGMDKDEACTSQTRCAVGNPKPELCVYSGEDDFDLYQTGTNASFCYIQN